MNMDHRTQESGQVLDMLEKQMKDLLLKKISESDKAAYEALADSQFSSDYWERLDKLSITPGYVLRCHLSKVYDPLIFSNCIDEPWDEQTLKAVAAELEKESGGIHGVDLRKKDWGKYLQDKQKIKKREIVLKIILITKMDQNTALDFLLACTMEPLSAREVWDSIVMFCLQAPGVYTWHDVEKMEEDFQIKVVQAKRNGICGPVEKIDETMSLWLPDQMAIHKDKPKTEAMDDFVSSMVSRYREFWDRNPTLKKHNGTVLSVQIDADGFSMGRYLAYRRLAQYLAVFYRWFETEHCNERKDVGEREEVEIFTRPLVFEMEKLSQTDQQRQEEFQNYLELHQDNLEESAVPTFGSLAKALLFHGGLVVHSEKPAKASSVAVQKISSGCGEEIIQWANTLGMRMYGVDRILTTGTHLEFFQRRDALFFSYFFLHAYSSWLLADDDTLLDLKEKYVRPEVESEDNPAKIQNNWLDAVYMLCEDALLENTSDSRKKRSGSARMDWAVANGCYTHLDEIYDMENTALAERMEIFHICFNYLLQGLGYTGLYLQNPLDRTLLMALTCGASLDTLLSDEAISKLDTFKVTDH